MKELAKGFMSGEKSLSDVKREIWQYDTYQKDYINFCAQAPYNASYELYLDQIGRASCRERV